MPLIVRFKTNTYMLLYKYETEQSIIGFVFEQVM
jgi:hypothetical protein